MAPTVDDRWLWLGLGGFALISAPLLARALRYIAEISAPLPAPCPATAVAPTVTPAIPPGPNAISTPSLELLSLQHDSRGARPARNMLAERFARDMDSCCRLLAELTDPDKTLHDQAYPMAYFLARYGQPFALDVLEVLRPLDDEENSWPLQDIAFYLLTKPNIQDSYFRERIADSTIDSAAEVLRVAMLERFARELCVDTHTYRLCVQFAAVDAGAHILEGMLHRDVTHFIWARDVLRMMYHYGYILCYNAEGQVYWASNPDAPPFTPEDGDEKRVGDPSNGSELFVRLMMAGAYFSAVFLSRFHTRSPLVAEAHSTRQAYLDVLYDQIRSQHAGILASLEHPSQDVPNPSLRGGSAPYAPDAPFPTRHAPPLSPRYTGSGANERALRRRRREAFVINDGAHPVSGDDVFMRGTSGLMVNEGRPTRLNATRRRNSRHVRLDAPAGWLNDAPGGPFPDSLEDVWSRFGAALRDEAAMLGPRGQAGF